MLIALYTSKKELKEHIGRKLRYQETSMFGPEYKDNGTFSVSNRPSITRLPGREFFASITMKDGLIAKVE